MIAPLREFARERRDTLLALLDGYVSAGRAILLRSDLRHGFDELARSTPDLVGTVLDELTGHAQEAVIHSPWVYFAVRPGIARWVHLRVHLEHLVPEEIGASEFLRFKERLVEPGENELLEIDFGPFGRGFPRAQEAASIGQGFEFLNRTLSGLLFEPGGAGREKLHEFLALHQLDGESLLLVRRFPDVPALRDALRAAMTRLRGAGEETPWKAVAPAMAGLGFAHGWGDTAGRAREMMALLVDLLEAPSPDALADFLGRIPMISRVLVVAPQGWFGQGDVLGLPDTGGQVVYILDQVRALEREMRERLSRQGVDVEPRIVIVSRLIPDAGSTGCGERIEEVTGCRSTRILRVPFRRPNGELVREWISRFQMWPFLERFARDVEHEAFAELGGRPDLIIGNYTQGNLVATLLSHRLGVTHCHIAHALEKARHLLSALHWREMEPEYHLSCQFTADLIAMNGADFIVTSTAQEIAGTETAMGQYESYVSFSMPGLYRVLDGVDLFDPKFNVVPPGTDPEVFFPWDRADRRLASLLPRIETMVFGPASNDSRGLLRDTGKPIIFAMARFERIKNVSALVEWYGRSDRLRRLANLLVVGGAVEVGRSSDTEEHEESERVHRLMDEHALDGQMRWLGCRLERNLAGELYRFVADRKGVFVQPALFEAFGLTVIEAMSSGLPIFATCHGGPSEVIEPGRSGFSIDPNDSASAVDAIAGFLERAARRAMSRRARE